MLALDRYAGRGLSGMTDEQWSASLTARFPRAWAERLLQRWRERHALDRRAGNLAHLERCEAIARAHRAGLKANANDADLCQRADEAARDMARRLQQRDAITRATLGDAVSPWSTRWRERAALLAAYAEALHWLDMSGLPLRWLGSITGFLRRVCCPRWWRRQLRRMHASAVESVARGLGLVHKRAGCYVSDESLRRRIGQCARNGRALESVQAVNEHGQAYTLAELAAKSPANREIRRHELMTRIAGFELIARECGHAAYFVTVTCPSRMHAYRTKGDGWGVEPNPRHDGTRPDEAQRYLARQWAKFRPAADRAGLDLYGFRIAEPNHDGTPHWHMLLFFPQRTARERPGYRVLVRLLRRYFLRNADPDERGARRHRVKVERIDWNRGSAAGYVAKYVAKNIDGYKVERDLYGNDAITSSQRVDAWASTWRVRQFQQIGGAPVTVWRELRRLHSEQGGAAEAIAQALEAVNITAQQAEVETEGAKRYTAANGWAAYLHLQGGYRVRRRRERVRLLREVTGELGRYGEPMAARIVGVEVDDVRRVTREALGIVPAITVQRTVRTEVESERCEWIVVPGGFVEQARERWREGMARGEAARPWSPVNNCTRLDHHPEPLFGPSVERHAKRGRWQVWKRGSATGEPDHAHPDRDRRRAGGPS